MILDDFLVRAALAGAGVACAAGPLGCFVVWRRMAYFGDAASHAAILGVALALAADVPVFGGVLLAAAAMAAGAAKLAGRSWAMDTLLGVAAHSALAVGLVTAALLPGVRLDLETYLFGDILAVGRGDLLVIWGAAAGVSALVAWRWRGLIASTLNADLAAAEEHDPELERLVLALALALLVAAGIKVVGALLITAMLVIPAAAARSFAKTPEAMAVQAAGIGMAAAGLGLALAWHADAPAGPSIVVAATVILALSMSLRGLLDRA
ncbi:metal ABC transporter permease [Rhodovulum sp. DZ06]|uniref:metal ABC transporter permease n=1 Tax=Rhodovulum sp. DZ06 TaxID=3425126 RepID=UPI003D3374D7